MGVRQTHDRTKICTVVAFAAEGLGERIPMRPYVKVGTIPKWVGTGRVLMHNHIRHSKDMPCGALPHALINITKRRKVFPAKSRTSWIRNNGQAGFQGG